ncbi:MAG: 30S ribosomal protein S20 [bacterium]|nr:30S ribosomal protein S20 [bacterium]
MANIKSQIKRNRQNEKRRQRNRAVRSEIITRTRSAEATAEYGDADETAEAARQAIKRIDKAASKGVLHPNTAARKKSRLMKRLARLQAE